MFAQEEFDLAIGKFSHMHKNRAYPKESLKLSTTFWKIMILGLLMDFYLSKSFPMKEKFVFIPLINLLCSNFLRVLLGGDSKLGTDHPEMLIIRNYTYVMTKPALLESARRR